MRAKVTANTPTTPASRIEEQEISLNSPGDTPLPKEFKDSTRHTSSSQQNAPPLHHGTTLTITQTLQSINAEDQARPRLVTFQQASMEDFYLSFHNEQLTKPISIDQGTGDYIYLTNYKIHDSNILVVSTSSEKSGQQKRNSENRLSVYSPSVHGHDEFCPRCGNDHCPVLRCTLCQHCGVRHFYGERCESKQRSSSPPTVGGCCVIL